MNFLRNRLVSIQYKILALIVALIVLPMSGISWMFYTQNVKSITEKVRVSNLNTVVQIGANLEYIFDSIKQTSLLFYQSDNVRGFLMERSLSALDQRRISLNDYMLNKLAYDNYLVAVDVCRLDNAQYRSTSDYPGISAAEAAQVLKQSGRLTFAGSQPSNFSGGIDAYVFDRKITDVNDLKVTLGQMRLYVDKRRIQSLFGNIPLAKSSAYYLVEDGKILIASDESAVGKRLADITGGALPEGKKGYDMLDLGSVPRMLTYYHMEYPDWYLVNLVSLEQIDREKSVTMQMILSTILLVVVVCLVIAYWLSSYILAPLKKVARSMKEVERENFSITVPVRGHDEITVLAKSFNRMSRRLDELVNQVYASHLREKDAKIRALQTQINPHFLYNTLDTICWMSRMEDAYETCRLVESLSKLFRMSLQSNETVTTVEKELEYTRHYLMIQECRCSDHISFQIHQEPGLESCQTVNFVLQPLIENAIQHGIEPTGRDGRIEISIRRDGDRLVYFVEDDGDGTDCRELNALIQNYREGRRGMAISGVNSRIALQYGQEYGLRFEVRAPHGIRAVVEQPYIDGRNEKDDNDDDRG